MTHRHPGHWILLALAALFIFGAGRSFVTLPEIFTCDKEKEECLILRKSIFDKSYKVVRRIPRYYIANVKADSFLPIREWFSRYHHSDSYYIQMEIVDLTGHKEYIPLFKNADHTGNYQYVQRQVQAIQKFMTSDQKQLKLEEDGGHRTDAYLFSAFCLFMALGILVFNKRENIRQQRWLEKQEERKLQKRERSLK